MRGNNDNGCSMLCSLLFIVIILHCIYHIDHKTTRLDREAAKLSKNMEGVREETCLVSESKSPDAATAIVDASVA
jgi:hypothetical protein